MAINNLSLTDEKAWDRSLWNLAGAQSVSGEVVNESTALTYSAFWNAINLYSGTISTLPLHLLRKTGKKKVMADENKLFRVMYQQANPYMEATVFRAALMAHILTWGNAYAEKVLDKMGQIVELWPITPDRVTPKWADEGIAYDIRVNGKIITLTRDKILHLHGLGYDGLMGYSIVALARKSIGLGMAMETFGALFFGNGTHPGGIIEQTGAPLKDSGAFRKVTNEIYGGLGKAHRLMLLETGMKYHNITIPPEDAQFLESRQFQVPEIARWFNLPPHKLKDLTKSSFNNIESEQISFVTDSILPWLILLEQQYDGQLLTLPQQTREKLFFKHNVEGLLRGNAENRAKFYQVMFNTGAMSINDIAEKEDMDPVDNEFADDHFVPMNMVPLSMIRENLTKNTVKPAENGSDTGEKEDENEQKPL